MMSSYSRAVLQDVVIMLLETCIGPLCYSSVEVNMRGTEKVATVVHLNKLKLPVCANILVGRAAW